MTKRRRSNGEGTLRRRADGRWEAALTYTGEDGRIRRHSVYGRSQSEVRAKLDEARRRLDVGEPVKDSTMTLAAWVETWVTTALAATDLKVTTRENYATVARTHLVPAPFGARPLAKLRPTDVESLLVRKRSAGLSASTVRRVHLVLRACLATAVRDGLIARSPAASVRSPRVERREAHALEAQQVGALLKAAAGDPLEALWLLLAGTGLRRGEALALSWGDVDLGAGTVRVRATLARTSEGLVRTPPKTDRSRRTVPLPRQVVEALRAHRAGQLADRLAVGPAWVDSELVFCTAIGTPLDPRNVFRAFTKLTKRAGLAGLATPHTLRHSAATRLLEGGADIRVVSELLGHSATAVTWDTYMHVSPRLMRDAADVLEAALGD
jgi:integrase